MSEIDFFISYTAPDKNWAEWIAWQLEAEDYTCAIQAWDFKPGGDFIEQMRTAIRNSRQTIAVLSPAYLESKFATAEMNAALAQDPDGKLATLLPVMVVPFEPPGMLRARVYIDLAGKSEELARRELVEGVRASRATRTKPAEAILFPAPPSFPEGETASTSIMTSTASKTDVLRILFMAAAAGVPLDLEKEVRLIRSRVSDSPFADCIKLDSRFDVGTEDFLPALNNVCPEVLHFSGNMDGNAILLQTRAGGTRRVSTSALLGLLRTVKDDLRLVVLNACHSSDCASELAELVGCAIGMAGKISDEAAIIFAADFYGAIANGRSVKNAFDQAVASLVFRGTDTANTFEIFCRKGVEASELYLIQKD